MLHLPLTHTPFPRLCTATHHRSSSWPTRPSAPSRTSRSGVTAVPLPSSRRTRKAGRDQWCSKCSAGQRASAASASDTTGSQVSAPPSRRAPTPSRVVRCLIAEASVLSTRCRLTLRRPRHFRRRHPHVPRPDAGPHDERHRHDQVAAVGGRHRVSNPRGCPNAIRHVRTTKEPVQPVPRFDQLIDLIMEPENKHVKLNVSTRADRGGLTADRLQDPE